MRESTAPQVIHHLLWDCAKFRRRMNAAVIKSGEHLDVPAFAFRQVLEFQLVNIGFEQRYRFIEEKRVVPANDQADSLFENRSKFLRVALEQLEGLVLHGQTIRWWPPSPASTTEWLTSIPPPA